MAVCKSGYKESRAYGVKQWRNIYNGRSQMSPNVDCFVGIYVVVREGRYCGVGIQSLPATRMMIFSGPTHHGILVCFGNKPSHQNGNGRYYDIVNCVRTMVG